MSNDHDQRFRIGRLKGDRFLVMHPDGRMIEVCGEIAAPWFRIDRGASTVVVLLPEPMSSEETEQDLGWLWENEGVQGNPPNDRYRINRLTREDRRRLTRPLTEAALRERRGSEQE